MEIIRNTSTANTSHPGDWITHSFHQWWRSRDLVLSRDQLLLVSVSVSGLEILVSVSVLCSEGLGLAQSNLPRPPRPQKFWFKTAKWWSTKKFPCTAIIIYCDGQSLALFIWTHYIMQVPCTSELYGFLGNLLCDESTSLTTSPGLLHLVCFS